VYLAEQSKKDVVLFASKLFKKKQTMALKFKTIVLN